MSLMMCSGECDTPIDTDFCGNWIGDLCYCDNCYEDLPVDSEGEPIIPQEAGD